MKEKHAVVIISRMVNGRERRIPLIGTLTGLHNPEDQREVEFMAWSRRDRKWQRCYIPQGEIVSMATLISENKDVGSGDLV